MQRSHCIPRDSPVPQGRLCCRSCLHPIMSPLRGKGALLPLWNVPKVGSWVLRCSLHSMTWDTMYDWSTGQKIYLQLVHQAMEWEGNCFWELCLMNLGNETQESTGWTLCRGRDMTADSVKGPWDPLSRSSSDVCCWLFSKSIKATREIPIVSLRNSHLTGFSSRGTYIIRDLLILSLSPPPRFCCSFQCSDSNMKYLHHVSIQKPLLKTLCNCCTVQHLLLIY